jgi:stearoyl-CoA desaturase (delta-9 desaturase)
MKNKSLFTLIIPIHLVSLSTIWLSGLSWLNLLYLFLGYIFISGLGIGVGLHRWASHRSVKLNKIAKPIVIYASIMSCQGHPYWWAAVHQSLHHRYTDTEKDIHSPINGKWNSFIGWLFKHDTGTLNYRHILHLTSEPLLNFSQKYYLHIIWGSWLLFGLVNLDFLIWAIMIPTVIALHLEGLINTFCHGKYGYRNFETTDQSCNVPILGWLAWGNGWHNNHHARPGHFDFGKTISGKPEFDPCVLFLPFIRQR